MNTEAEKTSSQIYVASAYPHEIETIATDILTSTEAARTGTLMVISPDNQALSEFASSVMYTLSNSFGLTAAYKLGLLWDESSAATLTKRDRELIAGIDPFTLAPDSLPPQISALGDKLAAKTERTYEQYDAENQRRVSRGEAPLDLVTNDATLAIYATIAAIEKVMTNYDLPAGSVMLAPLAAADQDTDISRLKQFGSRISQTFNLANKSGIESGLGHFAAAMADSANLIYSRSQRIFNRVEALERAARQGDLPPIFVQTTPENLYSLSIIAAEKGRVLTFHNTDELPYDVRTVCTNTIIAANWETLRQPDSSVTPEGVSRVYTVPEFRKLFLKFYLEQRLFQENLGGSATHVAVAIDALMQRLEASDPGLTRLLTAKNIDSTVGSLLGIKNVKKLFRLSQYLE